MSLIKRSVTRDTWEEELTNRVGWFLSDKGLKGIIAFIKELLRSVDIEHVDKEL